MPFPGFKIVGNILINSGTPGSSPDAGLYKSNSLGEWDHVATVHGMIDDMAFCDNVVTALKATYPDQRYACRLLNK